MKVSIQSIHCVAGEDLLENIQQKLNKMEARHNWIIEANVLLKEEKSDSHSKVAEIMLRVPGPDIFAQGQGDNFGLAVKRAMEGIRSQLKKYQEKNFTAH